MKSIALTGALALALTTAGCQSTGTGAGGLNNPSLNTAALIQDAQLAAELACSVAPTALTIAAIVSANPALATANQIASIICSRVAAVTPKASRKVSAARQGVRDYGTIVVGGRTIRVEATPVQ